MMATEATLQSDTLTPHGEVHNTASIAALGFWIYLMSDLIIFSGLFATYVVLSHNYAGGPTGKELFDLPYVLGETALLLVSSVTFGLTMLTLRKGDIRPIMLGLVVTFLLGLGFVSMEIHEFSQLIHEGAGPQRSGFLSAFFALVGTHGAHVACGMLWMVVMLVQLATKGLTAPVQSRLLRLGMFWHFLDIVWIGLFTVVYLMGVL